MPHQDTSRITSNAGLFTQKGIKIDKIITFFEAVNYTHQHDRTHTTHPSLSLKKNGGREDEIGEEITRWKIDPSPTR